MRQSLNLNAVNPVISTPTFPKTASATANHSGSDVDSISVVKTSQVICHCHNVTEIEIKRAIQNDGAESIEEISSQTGAGTGCTGCHCRVQRLIERKSATCGPCGWCTGCGCIAALCACKAA